MSCYFVAQITIHDMDEYRKYLDRVDAVFAKFNGRYLAVDEHPEVLEGEFHADRIVLIEFPDEAELKRWYLSPEYQEIMKFRQNAAYGDVLAVKGKVPDSPVVVKNLEEIKSLRGQSGHSSI